ncbi:MAG: hypothetical protein EA406_02910 [Rhodospirillales bacterium]|nr:MAG: hypothetical protein EA406_02910 [Rhodospirillales bacterium]
MMTDWPSRARVRPPQPPPGRVHFQRRRFGRTLLAALVLVLVTAFTPATLVVLLVGMLPTVVAAIADRSPGRHAAVTVGSINFIGVFPFLVGLWLSGNAVHDASALVTSVINLVLMYGAAALGWMIYLAMPLVVVAIWRLHGRSEVAGLRVRQKAMIDEWGEELERHPPRRSLTAK